MNIALSTSVMQRGHSGVGQYVLSLVRAFLPAAAQHEFTLFVLEDDLPLFDFAAHTMRLEAVSERFRSPIQNIFWHQAVLPQLARRLEIDVLHVPSYRRMLWSRPCALVSTIHDLAPFHLAEKYDWARMFYGRVVACPLAQRQHEIVAVSQLTARDVQTFFGIPPARVTVVPNGLDHDRFHPASADEARKIIARTHGITEPFFLYVARLEHPAKNHERLLAAFNRFKAATGSRWQLVLAGSDWHGAEKIHELVSDSRFHRDIHRLGFVSPGDLPRWYRAAGMFVFPSLYEGFGLPLIEAMACGCPVLSSTAGALAETVANAAGTLDPLHVPQMQSQLTRAASDATWREQLRAAGLARSREFDWNATAKATLDVYARAIANVAAAAAENSPRWNSSGEMPLASAYSFDPSTENSLSDAASQRVSSSAHETAR